MIANEDKWSDALICRILENTELFEYICFHVLYNIFGKDEVMSLNLISSSTENPVTANVTLIETVSEPRGNQYGQQKSRHSFTTMWKNVCFFLRLSDLTLDDTSEKSIHENEPKVFG